MSEDLKKFIIENSDEIFCTGGISDEKIEKIEIDLQVKLPNEYRAFLKEYGMLIGFGVEIFGYGKNDIISVSRETKRFRDLGLEKNHIVIQNCDEWIYCIKLSEELEKCPVISWDRGNTAPLEVSSSFNKYLYSALLDGKAIWDEDE